MELGGTFNLYERSSFQLINSYIIDSKSSYGGIISAKEFTVITIYNCTFTQNYGDANLFDIIESSLSMENVTIKNNLNNLVLASRSIIVLKEILIKDHTCSIVSQGCIINAFGSSQITILSSVFENVQSLERDNIFIHESSLNLSKVSFTLTTTQIKKGSCISGIDSSVQINYAYFSYFDGNAIYLENSALSLSNSVVMDYGNTSKLAERNKFGALVCLDCFEITIENTSFVGNKGVKGAAIYLYDSGRIESKAKCIIGGLFQGNEGEEKGGAVYLENQNIVIEEVSFNSNRAIDGGAIFCMLDGNSKITYISF